MSGIPSNESVPFKLIVDTLDDNYKFQIINFPSTKHTYIRYISQNVVDNWCQIATSDDIGVLSNLTTENKSNIVNAINETQDQIGDIEQLATNNKESLVDAIGEILSMIQVSTSEPISQPNNGWWMKEVQ